MIRKRLMTLVLAGALCGAVPATAGSLGAFADVLANLADMTSAADRAHDAYQDAVNRGRDYSRYEQTWRDNESRLERERIRSMTRITGERESTIRQLRDKGHGWASIARKFNINPAEFGYGQSRYDSDRDTWKGVPPGLAKKGGLPPGQAKKMGGGKPDKPGKGNKHKD